MLFTNDIVLFGETREALSRKLDDWMKALERKDFKIVARK